MWFKFIFNSLKWVAVKRYTNSKGMMHYYTESKSDLAKIVFVFEVQGSRLEKATNLQYRTLNIEHLLEIC